MKLDPIKFKVNMDKEYYILVRVADDHYPLVFNGLNSLGRVCYYAFTELFPLINDFFISENTVASVHDNLDTLLSNSDPINHFSYYAGTKFIILRSHCRDRNFEIYKIINTLNEFKEIYNV